MTKVYLQRIYKALNYIEENLDQDLNLSILAKVAGYSPFHFHRLFKAITDESPNKYVLRLRIERSAYQIKKDKNLSLSEIAFNNGFESLSNFSKNFKKYYGVSPSQLKEDADHFSKIRPINSKNEQARVEITDDLYEVNKLNQQDPVTAISIQNILPINVAYVNYIGAFDGVGSAYANVFKWTVFNGVKPKHRITRFYDSPEVTELSQIRQNACVEIEQTYEPNDLVSFSTIEPGKYAIGKFELAMKELDRAWQTMMVWVAEQELVPDEKRTCFEKYHEGEVVAAGHSLVEIFVPIKKTAL